MRYAQGVYPICPDYDTTVAFVDFVHTHGSSLLRAARGTLAPRVYVPLIEGLRNHTMRIGSAAGVFRPDNQSNHLHSAKHYFPGFTIKFLVKHSFTDSTGGMEVLPSHGYQGQFHWHDGQG